MIWNDEVGSVSIIEGGFVVCFEVLRHSLRRGAKERYEKNQSKDKNRILVPPEFKTTEF